MGIRGVGIVHLHFEWWFAGKRAGIRNKPKSSYIVVLHFRALTCVDFSSFFRKCTKSPKIHHFVLKPLFNLHKHNLYIKPTNKLSE